MTAGRQLFLDHLTGDRQVVFRFLCDLDFYIVLGIVASGHKTKIDRNK